MQLINFINIINLGYNNDHVEKITFYKINSSYCNIYDLRKVFYNTMKDSQISNRIYTVPNKYIDYPITLTLTNLEEVVQVNETFCNVIKHKYEEKNSILIITENNSVNTKIDEAKYIKFSLNIDKTILLDTMYKHGIVIYECMSDEEAYNRDNINLIRDKLNLVPDFITIIPWRSGNDNELEIIISIINTYKCNPLFILDCTPGISMSEVSNYLSIYNMELNVKYKNTFPYTISKI